MEPRERRHILCAIRVLHTLLALFFTSCIVYLYYAALARRRTPLLVAAVAALAIEGALVTFNRGECPLGAVHRRYGDDRPFFELIMPPRAARWAVPFLGAVTAAGILLAVLRPLRKP